MKLQNKNFSKRETKGIFFFSVQTLYPNSVLHIAALKLIIEILQNFPLSNKKTKHTDIELEQSALVNVLTLNVMQWNAISVH